MIKTDVLVIGSSAAGLVAATTGKKLNPDKKFLVISAMPIILIPCGIPYIFGTIGKSENNIMPVDKMYSAVDVDARHDEAVSINREKKRVTLKSGEEVSYEKLVIATGSIPYKPEWLEGVDLDNVFLVPKNKVYLDEMQTTLESCNSVITIGAGFIGVEISDESHKAGKEVTLVEKLPNILGLAFDEDISLKAENILKERGIQVITGTGVKRILGSKKAEGVELEDGRKLMADAVILSMGYKPNTGLARTSGLEISKHGFIKVDEYMRTEDSDVFAIGDCAEKHDFFTRKPSGVMLASTACAEARIAGMNLYKLSAIKTFGGTLSIFSTALGDTGFGVAGMTEKVAKKEGFDYVTGVFEGIDRHPGGFSDTHKQYVKLVVGRDSGMILGGEVSGGMSIGELTNSIGLIIENKLTVNSLLTAQIGTHPLLTASPAGYPLMKAAESAYLKILSHE